MKHVVMTTKTEETVTMGDAGKFRTGVPVPVEDDAQAEALINRVYPQFKEATAKDLAKLTEIEDPPEASKDKHDKKVGK
jgi:uncharacterized protein YdbL (DUF1318 family)